MGAISPGLGRLVGGFGGGSGQYVYQLGRLTWLTPLLPADQQPAVLAQALSAATAIPDAYFRSEVLIVLAPYLPADQQPAVLAQALSAATTIFQESSRTHILTWLAQRLPADLLTWSMKTVPKSAA
jgi:hypothetical protein